jgi:Velvet factor
MTPILQPAFGSPGYTYAQPSAPMGEAMGFQAAQPYVPATETAPSWGYPPQQPPNDRSTYQTSVLPSIHTFGRNTSPTTAVATANPGSTEVWHTESAIRDETDGVSAYRAWNTDGTFTAMENTSPHSAFSSPAVDSSLRGLPGGQISPHTGGEGTQWSQSPSSSVADPTVAERYVSESFSPSCQFDNSMYASASYAQQQSQSQHYHGNYSQNASAQNTPPTSGIPPLPRHTYTRTLVGPLSSNACRLHDEHRKPGIFFLFQDLSVRTEGMYSTMYAVSLFMTFPE